MATIAQVNSALSRYYNSLIINNTYNDQFLKYCDENSIDDEWFKELMAELLSTKEPQFELDTFLLEFDDNFPFPFNHTPSNKYHVISSILQTLYHNPQQTFSNLYSTIFG